MMPSTPSSQFVFLEIVSYTRFCLDCEDLAPPLPSCSAPLLAPGRRAPWLLPTSLVLSPGLGWFCWAWSFWPSWLKKSAAPSAVIAGRLDYKTLLGAGFEGAAGAFSWGLFSFLPRYLSTSKAALFLSMPNCLSSSS